MHDVLPARCGTTGVSGYDYGPKHLARQHRKIHNTYEPGGFRQSLTPQRYIMTAYTREKGLEEHILSLPDGRSLAYAHNGSSTSRIVVLFFPGLFSVGTATDVPLPCQKLEAHWVGLTLPGFGRSSIRSAGEKYNVALYRDVTTLLNRLHPLDDIDALFVGGGSYGSVMAQMLYGASYDLFPLGRKIKGCLILAPFPPLRHYPDYAKSMSWSTWISLGPPSQLFPFHSLQRLFKLAIGSQLQDEAGAAKFLQSAIFDKMDDAEKTRLNEWAVSKQRGGPEEFLTEMAKGVVRCCNDWTGFLEVSDIINSDWGFEPSGLDDEHTAKPILIVTSEKDDIGSVGGEWLEAKYKSATLRKLPGGHISSLCFMDELFEQLISMSRLIDAE